MTEIKEKVITAIRNLPDTATYEDIMDIVYVQEKIAKGLQQSEEGKVITDEDFEEHAKQRREHWQISLKSK